MLAGVGVNEGREKMSGGGGCTHSTAGGRVTTHAVRAHLSSDDVIRARVWGTLYSSSSSAGA